MYGGEACNKTIHVVEQTELDYLVPWPTSQISSSVVALQVESLGIDDLSGGGSLLALLIYPSGSTAVDQQSSFNGTRSPVVWVQENPVPSYDQQLPPTLIPYQQPIQLTYLSFRLISQTTLTPGPSFQARWKLTLYHANG